MSKVVKNKGTKSLKAMIKGMSKRRNSTKPMVFDPLVGKIVETPVDVVVAVKKRQVKGVKEVKENVLTIETTATCENTLKSINSVAYLFAKNYVPNVCEMYIFKDNQFTVSKAVKRKMSDHGVSFKTLQRVLFGTVGRVHDIDGTMLYDNGFVRVYVLNREVNKVEFTDKMKRLLHITKYSSNVGVKGLLVSVAVRYGDVVLAKDVLELLSSYSEVLLARSFATPLVTSKGVFYITRHASNRMSLRSVTLSDIRKSIENGDVVKNKRIHTYTDSFCTVVTSIGVVLTVFPKINSKKLLKVDDLDARQYALIADLYRRTGMDITSPIMVKKIKDALC